ncbi:DUF3772 domain-containing protein [Pararhodospirillum photometricum]|nr:DUF3772 domain-containing protein [Pararhodospirillum photometricum]
MSLPLLPRGFAPLACFVVLLTLCSVGPGGGTPVWAQDEAKPAAPLAERMDTGVKAWEKALNAIDAALNKPGVAATDTSLDDYAAKLRQIREQVPSLLTEATERVGEAERLLAALGPAPEGDKTTEPTDIRQRRTTYTTELTAWRARVAKAELAATRAEALMGRIAALRRSTLVTTLFDPTPVPWSASVLATAGNDALRALGQIGDAPDAWFASAPPDQPRGQTLGLVALWGLGGIVLGLLGRWLVLRQFGRKPGLVHPTYSQRTLGALAEGLGNGLLPSMVLGGVILWAQGALADQDLLRHLMTSTVAAILITVIARAFTRAALAPGLPDWRLTGHDDTQARKLARIIQGLALVLAVDLMLWQTTGDLDPAPETLWLVTSALKLAEGVILVRLSGRDLWRRQAGPEGEAVAQVAAVAEDDDARQGRLLLLLGRGVVILVALVGMGAGLFGYGRLGSFLINGLLATCALTGVGLVIRGVLRDVLGLLSRAPWLRARLGWEETALGRTRFWLNAALDLLLVSGYTLLVAPVWGIPAMEVFDTVVTLLTGIKVGSVTISVLNISVGIGVFLAAMALTRMVQGTLQRKVLVQTGMDPGVRHSLTTGLGYLGAVVASALAVATMGIDLTNVALIAGALSVGIGFGLQNIVNNFVSGLIILVERPIKVGDWVIIAQHEGLVKRISFRATELETFTQASIILPNAEILSRPFINLTHRNRLGRVDVKVGVAYDADPVRVKEILTEIARAHEHVLSLPAPWAVLTDFGDSALIFEVRAYTSNVMNRGSIASDIRLEINRRFNEEKIVIPYPHTVQLHRQPRPGDPVEGPVAASRPPGDWEMDAETV